MSRYEPSIIKQIFISNSLNEGVIRPDIGFAYIPYGIVLQLLNSSFRNKDNIRSFAEAFSLINSGITKPRREMSQYEKARIDLAMLLKSLEFNGVVDKVILHRMVLTKALVDPYISEMFLTLPRDRELVLVDLVPVIGPDHAYTSALSITILGEKTTYCAGLDELADGLLSSAPHSIGAKVSDELFKLAEELEMDANC